MGTDPSFSAALPPPQRCVPRPESHAPEAAFSTAESSVSSRLARRRSCVATASGAGELTVRALQFNRQPTRSTSAPPVSLATPARPPSPGPAPLRPPVKTARRNSRQELLKIDCHELQQLIVHVAGELSRLVRALVKIEIRIGRMWSVPRRACRVAVKDVVLRFTANSAYLGRCLYAISFASRKILNYVGSTIKETHGLRDFSAIQDVKPVVDELRLLQAHWSALTKSEETYGEVLSDASLVLEEAMDPDNLEPTASSVSKEIKELADAHLSLELCYRKVASCFVDLAITDWKPPILSPEDVKLAASGWNEIEATALAAATTVRRSTQALLEQTVSGGFMSKDEGEKALASLSSGVVGIQTSGAAASGSELVRASTTLGWRGSEE